VLKLRLCLKTNLRKDELEKLVLRLELNLQDSKQGQNGFCQGSEVGELGRKEQLKILSCALRHDLAAQVFELEESK